MSARMLCTDCGVTAHADTLLEGSDRLEAAAWVVGAVVGWLYCARRHWLRAKVCSHCGSHALVRESRAAAATLQPCGAETRVISSGGGRVVWPRGLRTPRERLRAGAPAAIVTVALFLGAGAAVAGGVPLELVAGAGLAWTLGAAAWLTLSTLRRRLTPPWVPECRAWDTRGRRLRIEVV